jgi:hypothetical protein
MSIESTWSFKSRGANHRIQLCVFGDTGDLDPGIKCKGPVHHIGSPGVGDIQIYLEIKGSWDSRAYGASSC